MCCSCGPFRAARQTLVGVESVGVKQTTMGIRRNGVRGDLYCSDLYILCTLSLQPYK